MWELCSAQHFTLLFLSITHPHMNTENWFFFFSNELGKKKKLSTVIVILVRHRDIIYIISVSL